MLEIFRIIFNPNLIVPLAIFGIPISAIIGKYYLEVQKLKLGQGGLKQEDILLLKQTLAENEDLKKRLENLETIITSMDKDLLRLKDPNKD